MKLSYEDLVAIAKAVFDIQQGPASVRVRQVEVVGHKLLLDREDSMNPGDDPNYYVIGITDQDFRESKKEVSQR